MEPDGGGGGGGGVGVSMVTVTDFLTLGPVAFVATTPKVVVALTVRLCIPGLTPAGVVALAPFPVQAKVVVPSALVQFALSVTGPDAEMVSGFEPLAVMLQTGTPATGGPAATQVIVGARTVPPVVQLEHAPEGSRIWTAY
jgi:hypothetical protein